MRIQELGGIELAPGDRVVSATYFQDSVIVVTHMGRIYEVKFSEWERV